MAHDMLVQFMMTILMEQLSKDTEKMMRLVVAIQKLASFDKQLIVDEYTESTLKKFLYEISGLLNNVTEIDTTHQLFERMNQQIEETHSVTAATEEMSASIQDVSNHAVMMAKETDDAVMKVDHSREIVNRALNDIEQVAQIYQLVLTDVKQLEENIEHTHSVINVIRDIA